MSSYLCPHCRRYDSSNLAWCQWCHAPKPPKRLSPGAMAAIIIFGIIMASQVAFHLIAALR